MALKGNFLAHGPSHEDSLGYFEKALETDPNLAIAHEGMGFYYLRQK